MGEMVSTLSRCLRGCALVGAVALLVGCTRVIFGTVQPVAGGAESASIPVADLLIQPGQFPARYRAVVLDATAVYRVLQDVDGVGAASIVDPPQSEPPLRAPPHSVLRGPADPGGAPPPLDRGPAAKRASTPGATGHSCDAGHRQP